MRSTSQIHGETDRQTGSSRRGRRRPAPRKRVEPSAAGASQRAGGLAEEAAATQRSPSAGEAAERRQVPPRGAEAPGSASVHLRSGTGSAAQWRGRAGRPSRRAGAAGEPGRGAPSSPRRGWVEGVWAAAPGPVRSIWLSSAGPRGARESSSVPPAHRRLRHALGRAAPLLLGGAGDEAGRVSHGRVAQWLDPTTELFRRRARAAGRDGAVGSRGGRSARVVYFLSRLLIYKYGQSNRIYYYISLVFFG